MQDSIKKRRVHIHGLVVPYGIISELFALLNCQIVLKIRAVHPFMTLWSVIRKRIPVNKGLIKGIGKTVAPYLVAVKAFLYKIQSIKSRRGNCFLKCRHENNTIRIMKILGNISLPKKYGKPRVTGPKKWRSKNCLTKNSNNCPTDNQKAIRERN